MDPFATLGIPRSYAVDLAALEKTHRELSRALHPDKYVDAGASERRAALSKAVEVNEAWRVVRDPIRRADALLQLAGVATGEEARGTASPEFLMEMLEQREALAEAKQARDLAAVRRMGSTVEARFAQGERALAEGFASGPKLANEANVAKGPNGAGGDLKGKVDELRYYRRFLDEVSAIEDELAA